MNAADYIYIVENFSSYGIDFRTVSGWEHSSTKEQSVGVAVERGDIIIKNQIYIYR